MACKGKLRKIVQGDVIRYEKLSCTGNCDDGSPCTWQLSRDHHGATREWCGCTDVEPSGCHLVLYTPGEGTPGSVQEAVCAGRCDAGECELVEEFRGESEEGAVYEVRCDCKKGKGGKKLGCLSMLLIPVLLAPFWVW